MPMSKIVPIDCEQDVLTARRLGRDLSEEMGFGLADQTRLATAISELARNVLQHAGRGACHIGHERDQDVIRLRVMVEDRGPGIPDIFAAMADGMSMSGGLGMGLPATKRLVHRFNIRSEPGHTQVQIEMCRPLTSSHSIQESIPPQESIPSEPSSSLEQTVTVRIARECDLHSVCRSARKLCESVGFDDLDTHRVAISVSELATNLLVHARGGELITLTTVCRQGRTGIKVVCHDDGPGISNVARAMEECYSTGGGMGCGLPTVARMMDELYIASDERGGTMLVARKWRNPINES